MAQLRMARRSILVPKEHGAWAMLIMPYLIGTGVSMRIGFESVLFLVAAVCVFAARCPLGLIGKAWAERRGRSQAGQTADVPAVRSGRLAATAAASETNPCRDRRWLWLGAYAGVAAGCGLILMLGYGRLAVLPLAFAALALLALETIVNKGRRDRTVQGELLAFAGLALTAPGAYYVATGRLNADVASVWLLSFLYAGASVFYVKLKVKQRALRAASLTLLARLSLGTELALYTLALLVVVLLLVMGGLIPLLAGVAFIPLVFKVLHDICRVPAELNLKRLGLVEVAHCCAFTALIIVFYR